MVKGTQVIAKVDIKALGVRAGDLGVVFNVYSDSAGTGFQVMFSNGEYNGFSEDEQMGERFVTEADYFLEVLDLIPELSAYRFKNVIQLSEDYRKGVFNVGFKI